LKPDTDAGREKPLSGKKVLLVDDSEINLHIVKEILAAEGLETEEATNGRQALEMAQSRAYDAVLMDIQIPEMDGYEVTQAIRKNPARRSLVIIAMTAHVLDNVRARCLKSGMNDFVSKPIEADALIEKLVQWILRTPATQEPSRQAKPDAGAPRLDYAGFPELPGIDVGDGLSRIHNNVVLYKKLLRVFRKSNLARRTTEIQGALEAGDHLKVRELAHSVKGVAGNLGMQPLADAAQSLETVFQNQQSDQYQEMLGVFSGELDRVCEGIALLER
jgi:two-component system sensor histidine kinase/response regulator